MQEEITMLRGIMKSAASQRRAIMRRIRDLEAEEMGLRRTKKQLEDEAERIAERESSAMRLIINLGGKIDE